MTFLPENLPVPRLDRLTIDRPVVLFALGAAILSGIVAGLVPAAQLSSREGTGGTNDVLKAAGRGLTGDLRNRRLRNMLVISEVGVAMILLVGAGLLIRSLLLLQQTEPGFDPTNVLTVRVPAPDRPPNFTSEHEKQRDLAGALRAAVHRAEKYAPIYGVAPLEDQLGTYLTQRRFQTSLLTGFAVVALLMAAIGIYGLIQYSSATRTQEIGLRMAIGAQAGDIFRMIIGEGLTLSLTGLVLGLIGARWLGRAGSSLLFGVTATDPVTFMTVSLLLTAVATTACYFPARRAMKVEPIVASRVT